MTYHASDEGYLTWLHHQIEPAANGNPARTHILLCEQLYKTEFRWTIPNDDNRIEDARELRIEFLEQFATDSDWIAEPMSALEVLFALAKRASFEGGGDPDDWFWLFIKNLGLYEYTDEGYTGWVAQSVASALDIWMDREYDDTGEGGIFPLQHSMLDQREIELWYQLAYYLLEGHTL